jgi:hypothetical protein
MIGAVEAFLDMINRTIPGLIASFDALWATIRPGMEAEALRDVYSQVQESNFSDDVFAVCASALSVMRARGLGWRRSGA